MNPTHFSGADTDSQDRWRDTVAPFEGELMLGLEAARREGLTITDELKESVMWGCFQRLSGERIARSWLTEFEKDPKRSTDFQAWVRERVHWTELAWIVSCEQPDVRNQPPRSAWSNARRELEQSEDSGKESARNAFQRIDDHLHDQSNKSLERYLLLHAEKTIKKVSGRRSCSHQDAEDLFFSKLKDYHKSYLRCESPNRSLTLRAMWKDLLEYSTRQSMSNNREQERKLRASEHELENLEAESNFRLENAETRSKVCEILTRKQAIVILMVFYRGWNQKRLAKRMNLSEAAVSGMKKQAIEKIRNSPETVAELGGIHALKA